MNRFTSKNIVLKIILLALLLPATGSQVSAQRSDNQKKPNIVLIYIDDMGFSDLNSYGEPYGNTLTETPHIDQLTEEGMKFTNAYSSAPLCTPARAALLTGRSPVRLNFEFVTKYEDDEYSWDDPEWENHWSGHRLLPPPFTLNLPLKEITIAEALNKGGYKTAISGKWHVATHYKHYKGWSPTHGPVQQGFDDAEETFGSHPYSYRIGEKLEDSEKLESGEYPSDELTDRAIKFIQQDHDQPFFLFVSHYYVHTPIENKAEWLIEKYREKAGPDVAEERIQYAAFVETLDFYVGQVLEAIDTKNIQDDTIVILTSDNGGHPEFAFNRPFRGSKWNLYEGGIRVPLIVRWPGIVNKGTSTDVPVIQTDFMPTFREIAGLEERPEKKIDGESIIPILRGESTNKFNERPIIWHFPYYHPEGESYNRAKAEIGVEDGYISRTTPQSAIRKGKYKFIYFYEEDRFELYDLSNDPAEQNNLSKKRPWDAQKMKEILFKKLYDADARFPRKNPQY